MPAATGVGVLHVPSVISHPRLAVGVNCVLFPQKSSIRLLGPFFGPAYRVVCIWVNHPVQRLAFLRGTLDLSDCADLNLP